MRRVERSSCSVLRTRRSCSPAQTQSRLRMRLWNGAEYATKVCFGANARSAAPGRLEPKSGLALMAGDVLKAITKTVTGRPRSRHWTQPEVDIEDDGAAVQIAARSASTLISGWEQAASPSQPKTGDAQAARRASSAIKPEAELSR